MLSSWSQIIIQEKCGGPFEKGHTIVLIFKWFRWVSDCSNIMQTRLTSEGFVVVVVFTSIFSQIHVFFSRIAFSLSQSLTKYGQQIVPD